MSFKVGDFVRLNAGWTKMRVVEVSKHKVYAAYCGSCPDPVYESSRYDCYDYCRAHSEFTKWNPATDQMCKMDHESNDVHEMYKLTSETGELDMRVKKEDLFETQEKKPRYGTFITKNSKGQYVLEMKGENGKVEAFDEGKLTKVVPYTFKAVCKTGSGMNQEDHYVGTAGEVAKGDVLLSNSGNIYYVLAINTGWENPRKVFKGSKLSATPLAN